MSEIVDISRIQETSDGDIEFEIELIEMYLDDAGDHIGHIGKHVAGENLIGLRQSAHTLKGSSANIGAVGIQDVAFIMERAGAENDLDQARAHLENLKTAFKETKVYFNAYLETLT